VPSILQIQATPFFFFSLRPIRLQEFSKHYFDPRGCYYLVVNVSYDRVRLTGSMRRTGWSNQILVESPCLAVHTPQQFNSLNLSKDSTITVEEEQKLRKNKGRQLMSVYMLQSTCTSITVLQYVCVVGWWMSSSFLSKWPKAVEYKAAP
jgi:hypothetical protein